VAEALQCPTILENGFGDHRIERILHENPSRPAAELSLLLLNEVRAWPPSSTPQQDDITFLLIDVLLGDFRVVSS